MINKEKAKEIASPLTNGFINNVAEAAAMCMSEWKDAQFKEYLEKKLESVRVEIDKCSKNTVKEYSLVMVREHLEKIINELFGE